MMKTLLAAALLSLSAQAEEKTLKQKFDETAKATDKELEVARRNVRRGLKDAQKKADKAHGEFKKGAADTAKRVKDSLDGKEKK
jgi:F0F1-type ATP synthase membrane subunit b/b'